MSIHPSLQKTRENNNKLDKTIEKLTLEEQKTENIALPLQQLALVDVAQYEQAIIDRQKLTVEGINSLKEVVKTVKEQTEITYQQILDALDRIEVEVKKRPNEELERETLQKINRQLSP